MKMSVAAFLPALFVRAGDWLLTFTVLVLSLHFSGSAAKGHASPQWTKGDEEGDWGTPEWAFHYQARYSIPQRRGNWRNIGLYIYGGGVADGQNAALIMKAHECSSGCYLGHSACKYSCLGMPTPPVWHPTIKSIWYLPAHYLNFCHIVINAELSVAYIFGNFQPQFQKKMGRRVNST